MELDGAVALVTGGTGGSATASAARWRGPAATSSSRITPRMSRRGHLPMN